MMDMDPRLRRLAEEQGAVFTRAQALACGHSSKQVERFVQRNAWTRVRHGVYAETLSWRALDSYAQHRGKIWGVLLRCDGDVVVSHVSAAVIHGWPTWKVDLDDVWVTRCARHRPRALADVRHLVADLAPHEISTIDGIRVTSAERTMVDIARTLPFESAVVTCDAALRMGADRSVVRRIFDHQARWPGARTASTALDFADGRSESVGESRTRVLCYEQGLPEPRLQAEVFGRAGRFLGRGDMLFEEHHTLVEFDGRLKYAPDPAVSPARRDAEIGDVVFREKTREDSIREEAGLEVVRVVWSDLNSPVSTASRIKAAFARADAVRRLAS